MAGQKSCHVIFLFFEERNIIGRGCYAPSYKRKNPSRANRYIP